VPGILEPLAQVLRDIREEAGVLQIEVAARAGVSRSVITKFEQSQLGVEIGIDSLVDAYAEECKVDWLTIWRRALAEAEGKQPPASTM